MNYMAPVIEAAAFRKPSVPLEIEQAFRTLIEWVGDNPDREGLVETPARAARAWLEYCKRLPRGSWPSPHADFR